MTNSVLPALLNEFIALLKETSVAGYVGIMDLTKAGDLIRGRTFSAFMPLIAVAGRDTVNNGTIEVRDRNGENAEAVPVADAARVIADRVAALLK